MFQLNLIKIELIQQVLKSIHKKDSEKYKSLLNVLLIKFLVESVNNTADNHVCIFALWLDYNRNDLEFNKLFFRFMFSTKSIKTVNLLTDYLFDKVRVFFLLFLNHLNRFVVVADRCVKNGPPPL